MPRTSEIEALQPREFLKRMAIDWKPGERVIVAPTLSTEDAKARFGDVEEVKPYLRWTPQPSA